MPRRWPPILVLVSVGACCTPAETPNAAAPPPADATPRPIPYAPATKATFRDADRAIFGRIVAVGKSPGFWSGYIPTYQSVTFEVIRRLDDLDRPAPRGWPQAGQRVTIWFGVIGPPDCDLISPELDPRIYRVGATGVVAADFGHPPHGDENLQVYAAFHARTSFHEMDEATMERELLTDAFTGPGVPRPR